MAITATENEEKNTKADCDALVSLHKTPWIRREWKFPFWFHDSVVLYQKMLVTHSHNALELANMCEWDL